MDADGLAIVIDRRPNDSHVTGSPDGSRANFDINCKTDLISDRMASQPFELGAGVFTVVGERLLAGYGHSPFKTKEIVDTT